MLWTEHKTYYNDEFFHSHGYIDDKDNPIKYDTDAKIKSFIEVFNPNKVLDCGCATGILVEGFYNIDPSIEVWGFDLGKVALDHCEPSISDKLLWLDVATEILPFEDKYFDLLIAYDFFEHQHPDYIDDVIGELCRVCGKYLFARQPFVALTMPEDQKEILMNDLNKYTHKARMELIGKIPEIPIPVPDKNCPYHPSEHGREYFIEKFEKQGMKEIILDEKYYIYPNDLQILSINTLIMERK